MTDKVQKIRKEVEKLRIKNTEAFDCGCDGTKCAGYDMACDDILSFIDSMQEEPVCSVWHDVSKETPIQGSNILMIRKEECSDFLPIAGCFHGTNSRLDGRNWGYYNGFCYNEIEPPVKWAYINDILSLSNIKRTVKDCKEPVSDDLEKEISRCILDEDMNFDSCARHFANWQKTKDESTTEDLSEYINELSKQFPEVSFAKLSRIAVRAAKWQKEHLWKPADGDDLPEIDREVIALLDNGKVVFAHRPNPEGWDAKSIITEKVERYIPETYGKGGWNIPNIKYWLDIELPKEC